MIRFIELSAEEIDVRTDIGPGKVLGATVTVDDGMEQPELAPLFREAPPRDQWERDFEELCALAPLNQHPVDDSREAIYGPDPGESQPS